MKAPSSSLSTVASPKAPMKTSGWAACASAIASRIGSILSTARSESPRISNSTIAERPSFEIWPAFSVSRGERMFITSPSRRSAPTTARVAATNCGELACSESLWMSTVSAAGCRKLSSRISSARPDSPGPEYSVACSVPTIDEPTKNVTTTNASHPRIASLRWFALQRPTRPVRLVGCLQGTYSSPSPLRRSGSGRSS